MLALSARAEADLLDARRWLEQPGSGLKARLKMTRINRAILELRFAPDRWPAGQIEGVRERLVEGYVIAYQVDRSRRRVRVMRVFGPYQDRSAF
jgi:plasmid stabilization system protein ParE